MVSCTEFIPFYSELFKYLDKKKGKREVEKYWEYVSDNYVKPLLGEKVKKYGIEGCFLYWGKSLNEENCDFTIIYNEDEKTFEIKMYGCPSKGMLNKLAYTNPYPDYCEHCGILYSRVLEKYGFTIDYNFAEVKQAKCNLKISGKKSDMEYAKITKYDTIAGLRLEMTKQVKMLKFINSANEDTPCGLYDFGDEGYINVIELETDENIPSFYEIHKQYYDIHYLLSGEEKIYYGMAKTMTPKGEYDEKNEARFYEGDGSCRSVTYKKGEGVSIPNDTAHMCGFAVNGKQKIKKAIIKVKL